VVHTWKIGVDNGNNPNLSMLISNGLSTDPKKLPVRQFQLLNAGSVKLLQGVHKRDDRWSVLGSCRHESLYTSGEVSRRAAGDEEEGETRP
jgi:hypothetical protein